MKKIYNSPVIELNAVKLMDVITLSGGEADGSTMTPVDFENLFI